MTTVHMDDFRFNDEFFLDSVELQRMRDAFPRVAFALHMPEASALFVDCDKRAKDAKRSFQLYGCGTVSLALIALLAAAADAIFIVPYFVDKPGADWVGKAVALAAAVCGLSAALIGWAGMGIGARKREWLKYRYICERLRLWRAQYVCAHIGDIVEAACEPPLRDKYVAERLRAFHSFTADHVVNVGARLAAVLKSDDRRRESILIEPHVRTAMLSAYASIKTRCTGSALEAAALEELFLAYDRIRFRGQVDYAEYMRGEGSLRTHVKTQHEILGAAGTGALIAIVVLHIGVIIGITAGIDALKSRAVHAAAIAFAFLGLAVRVLEDGLQPDVHFVRLEDYAETIAEARAKFVSARSAAEKLEGMIALEDAAARELCGFLRTASIARYVL